MVDIPASQIEPAPSFGTSVRRDFIHGMAKAAEGRFIVVLEPEKALDVDEMAALCEVAQDAVAA